MSDSLAAAIHDPPEGGGDPDQDLVGPDLVGSDLDGADLDGSDKARNDALRLALLESRQRWRQFGALAADILFEADAAGRLTFAAPDSVLGWPAHALLGQPGHVLLQDRLGPDPFCFTTAVVRRHTWMRTMRGEAICMALTASPLLDEKGRHRGIRGVAVNVTAQEQANAETASALRRGRALDRILDQMRQEVMAPRMMRAVLDGAMRALGAQGTAVLDLLPGTTQRVLHGVGEEALPLVQDIQQSLLTGDESTRALVSPDGRPLLVSPASTRFGDTAALLAWRGPGGRPWDDDDIILAASVTGVMRIVLEHGSIQRELARQARTDALTGLLNRRAFIEEATRRLDRLEAEGATAALLFIDLDGLKQLNDRAGHESGDAALMLTSALLRRTFRPTDLVARLGGDEFACWLDGADSFTAAERAETLRLTVPQEFAHLTAGQATGIGMSIGIAMRHPGSDETLDALLQRADQAMYEVKRNGRGHWRVSNVTRAA
jgi:diguanylate cyclase (GGDEF)-like protein